MDYRKLILSVFYSIVISQCTAQLIERPNVEFITEKEGLPFNSVSLFVKDKQGFLWVGGPDGLARYDGYNFIPIQSGKENDALPNNFVMSLLVDRQGMIWVGHLSGDVSRIDPATFKVWHTKIKNATDLPVQKIFCDSRGEIYCYVSLLGFHRFNKEKNEFTFISALNNLPKKGVAPSNNYNIVGDIYEDTNHVFWFTTANGIYRMLPPYEAFEHISTLSSDTNRPATVHQILPDGGQGFWLSTYGSGIIHFDLKTDRYETYLFQEGYPGTSNIVNTIAKKNDSELWVTNPGLGFGTFNLSSKKFSFFQNETLNGLVCSSLMVDSLGILWIDSDRGLMKWDLEDSRFHFLKLNVSRSDNHDYYAVENIFVEVSTGRKIIGTSFADGLHVFNADGKETILGYSYLPNAEPYQITREIFKDRNGNILVLTRDFLYRLTATNQLIKVDGPTDLLKPNELPYFYRIIQSTNGDLWIASSRSGLFHFDKQLKNWDRITVESPNSILENRIFGLLEDKAHRIWLAHSRKGISVYDPLNRTFSYFKNSEKDSTSLISNIFSDIAQTPEGEIWIATVKGISIFNEQIGSFKSMTIANGLPSEIISSVISDEEGNIWAVTNKGLVRIERKTHHITRFDIHDGLRGIYSSFELVNGGDHQIYVCTTQGYYSFNPASVMVHKRKNASIFITAIENQNSPLKNFNTSQALKIDYQSNSLSFEFASLNYLPRRNKYHYKMDGLDNAWSETNINRITYSGIPSGSYTFRVQLVGDENTEATVKIIVATPFWRQIWFRLLLISIGVIGVYLGYRVRLSQIRQEEKLKSDFNSKLAEVEMKALKAQMSPHFIFNSLNSINRYIVKSEPEKASVYLTKFSKLIRLILDNSNNKIISLEQELNAIRLYIELESLRFENKFSYSLTVQDELNPASIGIPPMLIQPFVENAIWHGLLHKNNNGHLDIKINRYAGGLQCVIMDNGVGRKKAAELKSKSVNKEKSYGMKITKDRLAMLNGESSISDVEIIDIIDREGNAQGTKVIIKILTAELEPDF